MGDAAHKVFLTALTFQGATIFPGIGCLIELLTIHLGKALPVAFKVRLGAINWLVLLQSVLQFVASSRQRFR